MPKRPSKSSANHLRAWREKRGLSQDALAKKIGTAGNVISLLESGDRALSHKWLLRLAPALGTTPGFLLDHDPDDLDTDLLQAVLSIPREQRSQALRILEALRPTGTDS